MAYSDLQKTEALALVAAGMSHRQVAAQTGVPHTTVSRWVNENFSTDTDVPIEAQVANEILAKVRVMLVGLEHLDPKDQQAVATAIDKLTGRYQSLLGQNDKTVVVESDGVDMWEAAFATLAKDEA